MPGNVVPTYFAAVSSVHPVYPDRAVGAAAFVVCGAGVVRGRVGEPLSSTFPLVIKNR